MFTTIEELSSQPLSAYFSIRERFVLTLCFMYIFSYGESKSIKHHTCDDDGYFKLWWFHDIKLNMNAYKFENFEYDSIRFIFLQKKKKKLTSDRYFQLQILLRSQYIME